jgi:hypothetical protein
MRDGLSNHGSVEILGGFPRQVNESERLDVVIQGYLMRNSHGAHLPNLFQTRQM